MKKEVYKNLGRALSMLVLFCCVAIFGGCGSSGGTIGTSPTTFSGVVVGTDGNGIPNALVTLLTTGDSGRSDAIGHFSFTSEVAPGSQEILVQVGSFEATTILMGAPQDASEVKVRIEVDELHGIVTAVVVEELDPTGPVTAPQQTFVATMRTKQGKAIEGAVLSIPALGVRDSSGTSGVCTLHTTAAINDVSFMVTYRDASGRFMLHGIPADRNVLIKLAIKLTVEEGQIDPGTGKPKKILNIDIGQALVR